MTGNESFSRNQERFLQALLLGMSIAASAKHAGISESTAFRWLKDPAIIAERERREATQRENEQLEIAHILNAGYAAMHRRVEALDRLADKLEAYMEEEKNIWLPDVKAIGTGEFAERVDLVTFNDALISEYRATFADLAAELGHRVKKQAMEHSGGIDVTGAKESLFNKLAAFAKKTDEQTEPRAT